MRVLHVHDAPHVAGGATGYLKRLFDEMAARGHEQWAFSLDQPAVHPALSGADFYRYPWTAPSWRRRLDFHHHHAPLASALQASIQRWKPDVVHVQNCAAFRSTVFPALGACQRPVLMTVHDFSLDDPNPAGLPRTGVTGALKSWLDRRSLQRARRAVFEAVDLFLCPTEALRDGLGFPSGRARLLRLPIAWAEAAPPPPLDPPEQPLRLLFAGSLYRSKGVDLLLQALATASGAARGARLQVAGDGDQREPLQAAAAQLGLRERVEFLGACDATRLDAAYAACHVLVLPSRVPENSPLTVLEAGARGRPAIAPAAGGVPELLAQERGWTFARGDASDLARTLERVAAAPAEQAARAARMRAWVRAEFEPRRHWDAVEEAWRSAAAARPSA